MRPAAKASSLSDGFFLLAMILAWLKINQALTLPLAAVIIIAFAFAEVYLSLRGTPQSGDKA